MKTQIAHFIFSTAFTFLSMPTAYSLGARNLPEETHAMKKIWQGIEIDQYSVPRTHQSNRFLREFGHSIEPYGDAITFFESEPGAHFIQGRISSFGGNSDYGVDRYENAALTGEHLRKMDADSDYYLAMRFNYGSKSKEGQAFFKNRRFLIINPKTLQGVVARAVDWGPHPRTKRIIDASPSVLTQLKLKTDDFVWVSFANNETQLGPIGLLEREHSFEKIPPRVRPQQAQRSPTQRYDHVAHVRAGIQKVSAFYRSRIERLRQAWTGSPQKQKRVRSNDAI